MSANSQLHQGSTRQEENAIWCSRMIPEQLMGFAGPSVLVSPYRTKPPQCHCEMAWVKPPKQDKQEVINVNRCPLWLFSEEATL